MSPPHPSKPPGGAVLFSDLLSGRWSANITRTKIGVETGHHPNREAATHCFCRIDDLRRVSELLRSGFHDPSSRPAWPRRRLRATSRQHWGQARGRRSPLRWVRVTREASRPAGPLQRSLTGHPPPCWSQHGGRRPDPTPAMVRLGPGWRPLWSRASW